jgi:hypothetical protein
MAPTLGELERLSLPELEAVYASPGSPGLPSGRFRGKVLARIDNEGARRLRSRVIEYAGFRLTPFGIDFSARTWFFFGPRLVRMGRFEPQLTHSRWRDAEVVALHYHRSRLPGPVRRLLYDEVRPLSPDLCLGIGGLNDGPGLGDLFFFALHRDEPAADAKSE